MEPLTDKMSKLSITKEKTKPENTKPEKTKPEYYFCQKCKEVPLIQIIDNAKIKIECRCQSKKTVTKELNEFLSELKEMNSKSENYMIVHSKCENKDVCKERTQIEFFCKICKIHLCYKCINKHDKRHEIVDLTKDIKEADLENQVKEIQFISNQMTEKIKNIKESNKDKNEEKLINNLENDFININKLFKCFIDTYENTKGSKNYYIRGNLLYNDIEGLFDLKMKEFEKATQPKKIPKENIKINKNDNSLTKGHFESSSLLKEKEKQGKKETKNLKEKHFETTSQLASKGTKKETECHKISINIKNTKGNIFKMDIPDYETIANMKKMIAEKEKVDPSKLRLIYAGKQLDDNFVVTAYQFDAKSIIHMVVMACEIADYD